jgi:putative ABC transport system permease protein
MTTLAAAVERPANGGMPARRTVLRWAWRLLRREWRQQVLVLALITVAVAATTLGVGVSTNTPLSPYVGFGSATDLATFSSASPAEVAAVAAWRSRFGAVDVIENETVTVPGTITTFDLRAQDPTGRYGSSLLSLVSGRFPRRAGEVAVTTAIATLIDLRVGGHLNVGGVLRLVVGVVQNPEDLLDQFALVVPGQVSQPDEVRVLFDAPGIAPAKLGKNVISTTLVTQSNPLNPQSISIALATLAMLLIALVAVAGFTVVAQRRLRSIGMLGALGAPDRLIRLVVRANGAMVGVAGAVVGVVVGFLAWLIYRPRLQSSAHHVIGVLQLPWTVIGLSMVLAVAAAYFAATRPARSVTRVSVVAALSGRPAAPHKLRRTAVPGVIFAVMAFFLLGAAGASGGKSLGMPELVFGFVALTVAVVLLAPFVLTALSGLTRTSPFALRMATRDLARYRARSGAALGAISVGVFIAVIVIVASAARFSNVLDYAGPNLTPTQMIIFTPNGPYGSSGPGTGDSAGSVSPAHVTAMAASARSIAAALGSHDVVELDTTSATLQHAAAGRAFAGPVYVATPQLLASFGIRASSLNPNAYILTMRPGLSSLSKMQLVYDSYFTGVNGPQHQIRMFACPPSSCLANPTIQEVPQLPSGTSAPNTVITEYAVHHLNLTTQVSGWLVETAHPLDALQLTNARATASAAGLRIETKSSIPTSAQIVDWATLVGILLALGILAMTIGLIRSEVASDMRILVATGASSVTRRNLAAATAGVLALAGAVIGTTAGYIAVAAYSRTSSSDGLSSLRSVPVANLLIILVAMPVGAALAGWLLAGREPAAFSRRPLE